MQLSPKTIVRSAIGGAAAIVALNLAMGSWFITPPGYVSIVTNAGSVQSTIYEEGLHFKMPFVAKAHDINIQALTYQSADVDAGTKDLQAVKAKLAVRYVVDKPDAQDVYRNYRDTETLVYRVLGPAVEESFKAVASNYSAEELITKRQAMRDAFIAALRTKLKDGYINVQDVAVTDFAFAKGYQDAVEAKVTAEQTAKKAEHDLNRIRIQGEQRVAQAEAEAKAIKAQAEAITKQGGAEYVQLKWIEKWNGQLPQTQLGANSNMLVSVGAK